MFNYYEETLQRTDVVVQYEMDVERDPIKIKAYAKQYLYMVEDASEVISCFLDCCGKQLQDFQGGYRDAIEYLNQTLEGKFDFEGMGDGQLFCLILNQYSDNVIDPENNAWRYAYACLANMNYRLLVHKEDGDIFLKQVRNRYKKQMYTGLDRFDDVSFFNECADNGLFDFECFLQIDTDSGESYYCFEYYVMSIKELAKER